MSDVKLLVGILEKIAKICKVNMIHEELNRDNFEGTEHWYEGSLIGRKELSQEIFNVINKGLNDSKN